MELMDLMRTNRTYRRFKQTAVSDEIIGEIMEAARNASSAANRQPLGYVVVKSPEKVAEVFALCVTTFFFVRMRKRYNYV